MGHSIQRMKLLGSTLLFLQAVAADAKGSDYYLYDYKVDELGNKKEKTAKKERSKRLMDPTVTQNCRALDGSRGAEKNKKEKRPAWEKIVGGWDIKNEHDWPWLVSFGRQCEGWNGPTCNGKFTPLEGGKGTGHICGGSLIWDGQYVVTAAHCLDDDMGKGEVAHWYVEHMEVLYGSADLNNADAVLIESAIIHPDFNPGNLSNDIALIKLKENAVTRPGSKAKPVCIPSKNYNIDNDFPTDNTAFAAGWGYTHEEGHRTTVVAKEVLLPLVEDDKCYQAFLDAESLQEWVSEGKVHHNLGTSTAICAGYPKGLDQWGNQADACQGDSGGPLVRKHPQAGYELVGLVSWGYGCARTYGVFTQVGTFGNWLQQSKAKLDRCDSHKDCIDMKKINGKKESDASKETSGRMTCAGHVLSDDEIARGCFCKKPKKPMTCPDFQEPNGGGSNQMDQPSVLPSGCGMTPQQEADGCTCKKGKVKCKKNKNKNPSGTAGGVSGGMPTSGGGTTTCFGTCQCQPGKKKQKVLSCSPCPSNCKCGKKIKCK